MAKFEPNCVNPVTSSAIAIASTPLAAATAMLASPLSPPPPAASYVPFVANCKPVINGVVASAVVDVLTGGVALLVKKLITLNVLSAVFMKYKSR